MKPTGTVLVVNATDTDGQAESLTAAIQSSGYDVLPPVDSVNGATVATSTIYTHGDRFSSIFNELFAAIPVTKGEDVSNGPIAEINSDDLISADVIIVLGNDLADRSWNPAAGPLVPVPEPGVLLILNASGSPEGAQRTKHLIESLGALGVDVVDGGEASRQIHGSMLMPIGDGTRWTHAVAHLANIEGFDTWTPDLATTPIPEDVDAVLLVGTET